MALLVNAPVTTLGKLAVISGRLDINTSNVLWVADSFEQRLIGNCRCLVTNCTDPSQTPEMTPLLILKSSLVSL
jgi:hypothetical protein